MPEILSATLENGMKLYVVERGDQPAVEIQCHVRTGSIHEEDNLGCGLSHFLEHMLFQGCRKYPGTAVSDRIGALGGEINAYTGLDRTVYHTEVPGRFAIDALDVLAMMVRYPEFPESRFSAELQVILRECDLGRDNPDHRLLERLWGNVYIRHNARYPIIGYPDRIADVTPDMVRAYYRRRYTPGRIFFLIVGSAGFQDMRDALAERLNDWKRGTLYDPVLQTEPEQTQSRVEHVTFDDPLSRIGAAVRLPDLTHPDIPALDVMCGLTCAGEASRLMQRLRQEQELAVDMDGFNCVQTFGGIFGVVASSLPSRQRKLEEALQREIADISVNGFSRKEIEREKRQQCAAHLRSLQSNGGIASLVSFGIYAADAPRTAEKYLSRLSSLDEEEVNRAATRYLQPERFSWVLQSRTHRTPRKPKPTASPADMTPGETLTRTGMRTIYLEDKRWPLAHFALVLPGGAIFESGKNGITRLLASLLGAGCRRWSESELTERLELCGAEWRISGGMNSLILQVNAPRRHFRRLMDLMLAMLSEPSFPERAFNRELCNAAAELNSQLEQPSYAATSSAVRMLFGSHPYGIGEFGTIDTLMSLDNEHVKNFYHSLLHRPQMVCAFGGDLSEAEAVAYADALDDALPAASVRMRLPDPPRFPTDAKFQRHPLAREQTMVCLALPGSDCIGEDYLVLRLLHSAVNGLSSRLFKQVREKNAMAYTTGMQMFSGWHPGSLIFFAATASESAPQALKLLRMETERIAADGLERAEFLEARDSLIFSLRRAHADVGARLHNAALSVFYGKSTMHSHQEIARLQSFTPEEIRPVLQKYLNGTTQAVMAGRC